MDLTMGRNNKPPYDDDTDDALYDDDLPFRVLRNNWKRKPGSPRSHGLDSERSGSSGTPYASRRNQRRPHQKDSGDRH